MTILYAARVMEQAPTAELFRNPLNPYTRGLLESIPGIDGTRHHRLQAIPGSIPSATESAAPDADFIRDAPSRFPNAPTPSRRSKTRAPNHYVACIRA